MSKKEQYNVTVMRKVSDLHKHEDNPRLIYDQSMQKLMDSISANRDLFNARPCLLSDRTGKLVIIGGNQRYEAAKMLGWDEVPTHLFPNLTEAEEKEKMIRDNVNNGQWDHDLLSANFDVDDLIAWDLHIPGVTDIIDAGDDTSSGIGESGTQTVPQGIDNEPKRIILYYDDETHANVIADFREFARMNYIDEGDDSAIVLRLLELWKEHKDDSL